MSRLLAAARKRIAAVGAGVAVLLLASVAWATPGAFGGYSARITNSADSAATAAYFKCSDALGADKGAALFQWPLGDTSGTAVSDISGAARTGTRVGTLVTDSSTPIACPRDTITSTTWSLDGATQYAYYGTQQTAPTAFTIEVWFKTSTAAGKLIGFGSATTGASGSYDRHLYINTAGQLVFGVYTGSTKTLATTTAVTDNAWHHAAASLSPTTGMALYLDGRSVATDPATTTAQSFTGYWRVGYDSLSSWPGAPTNAFFKGRLRYAAVFTSVLTPAQIRAHWAAGV